MLNTGTLSAIPVCEEDSPYYGEYLAVKKLVEDFIAERLPTYVLSVNVDESALPAVVRFEIRPSKREKHRNATMWLNLYVSDTLGSGKVRHGSPLSLGDSVIHDISAKPTAYNRHILHVYEDLMMRLSRTLEGGCPELHCSWEVFLTAAFALPKPEHRSRLIAVLGLNLTVKEA